MRTLLVVALIAPLTGCIVHTHDRTRTRTVVREAPRSCPPAHHLEGGVCVHNGRANGHHKR